MCTRSHPSIARTARSALASITPGARLQQHLPQTALRRLLGPIAFRCVQTAISSSAREGVEEPGQRTWRRRPDGVSAARMSASPYATSTGMVSLHRAIRSAASSRASNMPPLRRRRSELCGSVPGGRQWRRPWRGRRHQLTEGFRERVGRVLGNHVPAARRIAPTGSLSIGLQLTVQGVADDGPAEREHRQIQRNASRVRDRRRGDLFTPTCPTRRLLDRIGVKWTSMLVKRLADDGGEIRFAELQRQAPGISRKMLAQTLRELEQDGLVLQRAPRMGRAEHGDDRRAPHGHRRGVRGGQTPAAPHP